MGICICSGRELKGMVANRQGRRAGIIFSSTQRNAGYTLTEVIIYLGLFSMLITITSPFVHYYMKVDLLEQLPLEREVQIFFQQLEREVHSGAAYSIQGGRLIISTTEGHISFQQLGSNVRRQVNGTGHVVMLQHVESIAWREIDAMLFEVAVELSLGEQSYQVRRVIGLRVEE